MDPLDPQIVTTGRDLAELAVKGWVGKALVEKLLGPTAAYLGERTKGLVEKCDVNVNSIFARAARKLGPRIDEPGEVNPRILRGILSDGSFTEDEVAAEYFGGVLASSRTPDGRDDRGVAFLALVRDLSTYQLRLHYLLYRAIRARFRGQQLAVGLPADRARMRLFIPLNAFSAEIGATPEQLATVLEHTVHGVARFGLIDSPFYFGREEYIRRAWSEVPSAGLLLSPSAYGAELFLWAHGLGHLPVRHFLDAQTHFEHSDGAPVPDGLVGVPQQEDVAAIRREIDSAIAELSQHINRAEARLAERMHLQALPNNVREHVRHIADKLRDLPNDVAAFLLERDLDACLSPPEESTETDKIALVRTLRTNLQMLLKEQAKPDTA